MSSLHVLSRVNPSLDRLQMSRSLLPVIGVHQRRGINETQQGMGTQPAAQRLHLIAQDEEGPEALLDQAGSLPKSGSPITSTR